MIYMADVLDAFILLMDTNEVMAFVIALKHSKKSLVNLFEQEHLRVHLWKLGS